MQDERWQQAIIGLVTLDLEGKIVAVNQTFTDLVGYTATELCGNHIEKVMNNGSRFFFHSLVYPKLRMEQKVTEVYLLLQTKTGESCSVMLNAQLFESEKLIDCYFVQDRQRIVHTKEIRAINAALEEALKEQTRLHEELLSVNHELKRYAETDFLTGLYNRRIFMEKAENMYEHFREDGRVFSICIFDVDHFKFVNDQYGHLVGDAVLVGIADEMRKFFDATCTLARFGGEEFIVLLPDSDKQATCEKIERFREQVKFQKWQDVSVSISFGVNTVTYFHEIGDIIIGADRALYAAKRWGRDQVVHREALDEQN